MAENRKKWLKNHWTYNWWKYLLAAVISCMGVNVLFTMTAYRAPEHKKIELYVLNGYADQAAMKQDLEEAFFAAHPDQEEFVVMNINLASEDVYVRMQYTTYVAAQQGDVLIMSKAEAEQLAGSGADNAFLELTPYIESGVIQLAGDEDELLLLKDSNGKEGVYGISAQKLFGLLDYGNDPTGSYLFIMDYSGNEDTAASVVNMLLQRYRADAPDWFEQKKQELGSQGVLF